MKKRATVAVAALAVIGGLVPAAAQTVPSFGQPLGNQRLDGIVVRFAEGTYDLELRDDRGILDTVRLHDHTIIFPIGTTLAPGMRVRIVGFNAGNAFTANEIDAARRTLRDARTEPRWYAEWDGTRRGRARAYGNPPAPAFVNPPAPP
jgi:hypothetical protein